MVHVLYGHSIPSPVGVGGRTSRSAPYRGEYVKVHVYWDVAE